MMLQQNSLTGSVLALRLSCGGPDAFIVQQAPCDVSTKTENHFGTRTSEDMQEILYGLSSNDCFIINLLPAN